MKEKKIIVKGNQISLILRQDDNDFISLTDIARSKNPEFPADVIKNWLRSRSTIDFIGTWEQINNPSFNMVEFDQFKNQAGINSFVMSPDKWIKTTSSIGLRSKSGRYGGGTYAHKDIAFEFGSWISAEFKLYLIKEFQRLKSDENNKLSLGWDVKRQLTKINYRIHTDAIATNLIPVDLSKIQKNIIFGSEADILNKALFGLTAKEWRDRNKGKEGNIRDYCDVTQLVVLANLETLNANFIEQGISQFNRLIELNRLAISHMKSLLGLNSIKKLESNLKNNLKLK